MKIMCQCGRNVSYEVPLQNFATRRVPCGPSCRSSQPNQFQVTHEPFGSSPESSGRLSDVMFGGQFALKGGDSSR